MAVWKKVKVGDFLFEREGRYKPDAKEIQGLQRIDKIDFSGNFHVANKPSKTNMILIKSGDLVISGINVAKGALGVYHGDADVTATIHYSSYTFDESKVSVEFFKRFLKSPIFIQLLKEQVKGGIKTEIKPKHLLPLEIMLPDKDEQLFILSQFQRIENEDAELKHELTRQQALLKKLRQQILQEAIEGKLTADWRAQNPDVEPASELLKRIAAEKAQLVKDKKIKAQKPLPSITDEEKPFELPQGWEWCRLEQILVVLLGGYAFKSPLFKKSGTKQVLRLGNIRPYTLRLDEKPVYIDNEYAKEAESVKLRPGDVLITMTGTRGKRDYCYTVLLEEKDFQSSELYLNQRVGCLRFSPNIIKKYYDYCLKDDRLLDQIFSTATGAANQANIGSNTLRSWLVPLPPIEEQQTIVTKVEKLLALCDQLEIQITQNQHHAAQLMQAVLKEAFSHNSEVAPAVTKSKVSADTPEVAGA